MAKEKHKIRNTTGDNLNTNSKLLVKHLHLHYFYEIQDSLLTNIYRAVRYSTIVKLVFVSFLRPI